MRVQLREGSIFFCLRYGHFTQAKKLMGLKQCVACYRIKE